MKQRKIILFLVNNEIVAEEPKDLDILDIEKMKWTICLECECSYHDIEVRIELLDLQLSDIDSSSDGLIDWKDTQAKIITGVKLNLIEGSDQHLDAIRENKLEDYLIFV